MAQPRDSDVSEDEYDPWEPFNERMFEFNRRLDRFILNPSPGLQLHHARRAADHDLERLRQHRLPATLREQLLQGKLKRHAGDRRSSSTAARRWRPLRPGKDVFGWSEREDFGQTLGSTASAPARS